MVLNQDRHCVSILEPRICQEYEYIETVLRNTLYTWRKKSLTCDEAPMISAVFKDTVKRTDLCGLEL
jgi:hypothetical protein